MPAILTAKQVEAQRLLGGKAQNIMLFGGARSGKSFVGCRRVVARALMAPESRHLICRFRMNAVMESVHADTMPKMVTSVHRFRGPASAC